MRSGAPPLFLPFCLRSTFYSRAVQIERLTFPSRRPPYSGGATIPGFHRIPEELYTFTGGMGRMWLGDED